MAGYQFNLVVIGTGPGGEGAAMQAGKNGKKVAVVERLSKIGGACTHVGTIPSKALRFAIYRMTEVNANPLFREAGVSAEFEFPQLRKTAEGVIRQQEAMRRGFYEKNDIPVHTGQARFVDPHTVEIVDAKGVREQITAENFVIAVGSRPYRPPDIDFSHPRIFDSDTILNLTFTPWSVSIYGAG